MIIQFDNTRLSAFKDCPRKYYFLHHRCLRPKREAVPLSFGSALHAALGEYDKARFFGADHEAAVFAAAKAAAGWSPPTMDAKRTPAKLLRTVVDYCDRWRDPPPADIGGKPALELSFSFPLPITAPNGEQYHYCGLIDRIGEINGALFAFERKHTTSHLSEMYFARYSPPNSQLLGYVYASRVVFKRPLAGVIVDVVQVAETFTDFGRRQVVCTDEMLDEWLESTIYWIRQVEASTAHGIWPMNSESCTKFGQCGFLPVCSQTPSVRENFLAVDYEPYTWSPET